MADRIYTIPPAAVASMDEHGLLLRVSKGEEAAFREVFDVYKPLLLGFVYRITKDMVGSEEVVQDIFVKIWQTRETLTGIRDFKNYLFILSRNHALNSLDKQLRLKARQGEYQQTIEEGARNASDELAEVNGRPYILIDEAIDRLPELQKTAWLLSRHEGMTIAQIAAEMGITTRTVDRYIRSAGDSMKDYIKTHSLSLLVLLAAANYF